ncbi:L-type lectin-domain containing receptor kinase IX.1 [Camellia lanceoleosa]|uniref:L-type lectin-domain containing receptor kinase IX.1 n=1 Tax=Camellia lanceoleosa TaxID=1840588 RepID=A0ACC0FQ03_9ERIC|nr:L-type lectin-domain containing receptor kinase IX.1 [Camellia lanceoleosa]
MAVCNSWPWNPLPSPILVCSLFFFIYFPLHATALNFNFPNFNETLQNSSIIVEGQANVSTQGIQIIPPKETWKAGRATYKDPLHLGDKASGTLADFSTHFSFIIDSEGNSTFADGFAFSLLPSNYTPMNANGAAMGLPILSIFPPLSTPFVAVEFDTFQNGQWDPLDITPTTHVGIDISSITSNVTAVWYNNITYGKENEAWVSYNSSSKNLRVVFTGYKDNNIFQTSLNFSVDLREHLPEWVTVGFSAGTGDLYESHIVKSWSFNSSLQIDVPSPNATSSPRKNKHALVVGLSVGSAALVGGLALFGFVKWKKSRAPKEDGEIAHDMSMDDEFDAGIGPKKFSYAELVRATNNFADEQKLGEGGFGGVYKGFLRESNSYVAVKRISKGSKQGIKEYASEVKIISRLRHRNLVQLLGWCHDKNELLLVYEFMENGSLDNHLFNEKSMLTWTVRYKIAQGLASALLYLHEGWEQCVVHRDVKPNNVMLDSNFNTKLGDFGLARFVDHGKNTRTTILAGTRGYMAPEYLVTGKASKESDVYSFGIVALEIACGRRPIDQNVEESHMVLVEWVWDLYGTNRLLEAAVDTNICPDFNQKEMECLMIVGLWCAHPDQNLRPSISQAIHVLNFEAPLPILPTKMPIATCLVFVDDDQVNLEESV